MVISDMLTRACELWVPSHLSTLIRLFLETSQVQLLQDPEPLGMGIQAVL